MIFREYLRMRSAGKVVNYLHSKNIMTRKGNKWSRQAISIIISNRTYRGRVRQGDFEVAGRHKAIIDASLFYRVKKIREKNMRSKS